MEYQQRYDAYLHQLETALTSTSQKAFYAECEVSKAALYSLMAGGKRVRGVLCLAVCEMLCGDMALAAQYGAALEMLHCYSLIHDDLPCMDNDDFRRGKPSCHKVFGEATALLAGDALLTAAFETLACASGSASQNMAAVSMLSRCAGTQGMILGQEMDLHFETTPATQEQMREIHRNKTGMLIHAAAQLGAIAADAFDADKQAIQTYAFDIGLVFQIVDDVLDVTATQETLGKPIHSDEKSHKTTFVTLFGVEKSLQMAQEMTKTSCEVLEQNFEDKAQFLTELARKLVAREH